MKTIPSAIKTGGDAEVLSIPTPQSGEYSLYFHIPFCTRKCDYCHFYVLKDSDSSQALYMETLKKQWELWSALLPKKAPHSIYFGGGTPSLLHPRHFETILSWISPSTECEITLEANPEKLSLEKLSSLKQSGINRLSIGVQSLDDTLLKHLSRTHSAQVAKEALFNAEKVGFKNVSIDLLYDIPYQTLSAWQKSLNDALKLPFHHLSFYNLTIEPGTRFWKTKPPQPDSEVSLAMLNWGVERLKEAGFVRYEISAFTKEALYSRHNVGYWLGRPFLGFGPSAFSDWEGSRFQTVANLVQLAKRLEREEDPISYRETLPPSAREKERISVALRLAQGVKTALRFPHLEAQGLVQVSNDTLFLTEKGKLFYDTVAEEIIELPSWQESPNASYCSS